MTHGIHINNNGDYVFLLSFFYSTLLDYTKIKIIYKIVRPRTNQPPGTQCGSSPTASGPLSVYHYRFDHKASLAARGIDQRLVGSTR